jgi:uncharacterized protein YndB with AHSA1/START domain/DNA-binding transcriptional ArsR family regulator
MGMDDVFRALADPHRRRLLDRLNDRNGQTLRELGADLDMTRQAVSKHLAVLEAALLVTTVRRGREKLHYLNPAPIHEIADRWIHRYDRARVEALADLKHALEDTDMTNASRPEFVYTTYIRTTPERLFAALTEPVFTQRYWNCAFDTDWRPGSPMTWVLRDGIRNVDAEQIVLECDPPRRLSYRWHAFTPEWAEAYGQDEELRARLATEARSKVTFELEPDGPLVKLTVVHDDFEPGSTVAEMVSGGWPRVLGDLKSLLEGAAGGGFTTHAVASAPAGAVYRALTTLEGLGGWWMPDVSGTPTAGGEVTFRFEGEHVTMRVVYAEAPSLVVWQCTESTRFPEWVGNSIWFEVQPRDQSSSTIDFTQVGLLTTCDCYDICSNGWDHYVESLASFAAGQGGHPYGSEQWETRRARAATS